MHTGIPLFGQLHAAVGVSDYGCWQEVLVAVYVVAVKVRVNQVAYGLWCDVLYGGVEESKAYAFATSDRL